MGYYALDDGCAKLNRVAWPRFFTPVLAMSAITASPLKPLWPKFAYKEHQITGVRWMLQRESAAGPRGGILCDEMGLGKTIQMVALMKLGATKPREQNLLIAPVAVLEQWKTVIRRSGMSVLVPNPSGASWTKEGGGALGAGSQVHVIGYEAVIRRPTLATVFKWDRVIYDEAHRLASGNSSTEVAKHLKTTHMWMLTGTPIVNQLKDLTTLLELVGVDVPATKNIKLLAPILEKYVIARTMNQLRASIPDAPPVPVFKTVSLDFKTDDEAEFYKGMSGIITRRWKALEADGSGAAALEKLKLFMRLRQLSLHPQIYIAARKAALKSLYARADWEDSSTKFDAIRELVCEAPKSHKWIIFCHFRHEMEMLEQMLHAQGAVELVQQYHGGLNASQKQDVLNRTTMPVAAGKQEVLLVQLQSGGTGLNLQHFDQIIFTGPWWTSALMEQAVGRAVRIGQQKVVTVYHLRLKEEEALNIDSYMFEKADAKGDLCRKVLESAYSSFKTPEPAKPAKDYREVLKLVAPFLEPEITLTDIIRENGRP